jgi:dATP pyrophosphohydrolase
MSDFKIPESVLVVIHTPALDVLLIRRADAAAFWQSVTGSKDTVEGRTRGP